MPGFKPEPTGNLEDSHRLSAGFVSTLKASGALVKGHREENVGRRAGFGCLVGTELASRPGPILARAPKNS